VDWGRGEEVDTTSLPLPPFFPPAPVETGRGVDETTDTLLVETGREVASEVFTPFPPFPPLSVGDGTAGELVERPSDETVELSTLEETSVAVDVTTEVDDMPLEAGGRTEDERPLEAGGRAEDERPLEAGGIAEDEVELPAAPLSVTVK